MKPEEMTDGSTAIPSTPHVLPVPSSGGEYDVIIGANLLAQAGRYVATAIGSTSAQILLIYDEVLTAHGYPELVLRSLTDVFVQVESVSVPSGEHSKSFAQAQLLYTVCVRAGLDRDAVIIALGGGVIGDLAGFVAATYMRGVRFIQMPTTLLAHDSSIGGKVAVNLPEGKNLIGAFHPPRLVLYDVSTLTSLPLAERANGLAEAIKHGVIRDQALFAWIEGCVESILAGEADTLSALLYRSCKIKADIVAIDEREAGLRAILNFGHTIGHAIEAAMHGELSHGAAVAIGMVLETRVAQALGMADAGVEERLSSLLTQATLPIQLPAALRSEEAIQRVIELMRHDKKAVRRSLSFVLPKAIGEVETVKSVDVATVRKVLE